MRRQRGWTLIELLIVVLVMGVVGTTMATIFRTVHEEERYSAALAEDLRQLRRAVQHVEYGLREASSIEELDVRLEDGELCAGEDRLAGNIALFAVEEEARVARVRIGLGPRRDVPHRRPVVMEFHVRLRGRGGGR